MSAIKRNFLRHGRGNTTGQPPRARGVKRQTNRHIIKRAIKSFRAVRVGNVVRQLGGMYPVELHATKGWRHVPAWS